jgi:hypothetical protein
MPPTALISYRLNRVRQQQGDAAQLGWNRRNQRHDVDMHEVMEHVDVRIGSRDMLRWAVHEGVVAFGAHNAL